MPDPLDLDGIKKRQGYIDQGDDGSDHFESLIWDQALAVPALLAEIDRLRQPPPAGSFMAHLHEPPNVGK